MALDGTRLHLTHWPVASPSRSPQQPLRGVVQTLHGFGEHQGRFEPLVRPGLSLAESVHAANLEATHAPDACMAVLGMGEDGHTASLFPGAQQLPQVLASERPYAALDASGCPVAGDWPQRITLTPAGLAHARQHLLLLRGQSKRQVLVRALEGEDVLQMPIRVVIGRGNPPLRVHWCQ